MFHWPIWQFEWGPFRFDNLRRASNDILKVFKRNKLDFSKYDFFFCNETEQTKLHIFPMCIFNECKFFATFSIFLFVFQTLMHFNETYSALIRCSERKYFPLFIFKRCLFKMPTSHSFSYFSFV